MNDKVQAWDSVRFFVLLDKEILCEDDQSGVVLNACLQEELGRE